MSKCSRLKLTPSYHKIAGKTPEEQDIEAQKWVDDNQPVCHICDSPQDYRDIREYDDDFKVRTKCSNHSKTVHFSFLFPKQRKKLQRRRKLQRKRKLKRSLNHFQKELRKTPQQHIFIEVNAQNAKKKQSKSQIQKQTKTETKCPFILARNAMDLGNFKFPIFLSSTFSSDDLIFYRFFIIFVGFGPFSYKRNKSFIK